VKLRKKDLAAVVAHGLGLLAASIVVVPGLAVALYALAVWAWPWLWSPVALGAALGLSLVVPIGVLLARWDKLATEGRNSPDLAIRGDVLRLVRWLIQTMDERLPGDLGEATVAKLHARFGRVVCGIYWLGWRNRAHGLRRYVSQPLHGAEGEAAWRRRFEEVDGVAFGVREDGSWYYSRRLWFGLKFVTGHRVYQLLDKSTYLPVPTCTVKGA
jgi:hypothetical protein